MARRTFIAPLLLALAAGSALAQDVRLYGAGESVDPRDVAKILEAKPMKMRSIRLLDDTPSSQAAQQPAGATADPSRIRSAALALPVHFAFDSAEIQPSARPQLDALAEGIRMLPTIQAVVIEGHTDAVGSDTYNEQLSQRRAQAVKRYLVAAHGIEATRLRAVGMGEYAPLQGRDPTASENRRVQFRGE
jgi:OmpA-OmpF porin, OOP family